jgi:Peptidase M15
MSHVKIAASAAVVCATFGIATTAEADGIRKQSPSVSTGCLRGDLMGILRRASNHFGSAVVITSGYRGGRGRSYHAKCMAADVQIAGVGSGTLARYFRAQAGVGGVGTYGHTRSVHVDVASRKFNWHGRRSSRRFAEACPCCGSAVHGQRSTPGCERSVILPDLKLGSARV